MTQTTTEPTVEDIKAEIGQTPFEPLLPVEKKLIAWSLGLGLALLVVLLFVGRYFPAIA